MLLISCLKQGHKCSFLKSNKRIKRVCTSSFGKHSKKINKRRVFYVTGASLGSCGALLYFTLNSQEHRKVIDASSSKLPRSDLKKQDDVSDYFFKIGYEDDWLVFPFFPRGTLIQKQNGDSGAFNRLSISEILSPWELSSSDDPWVLLQLTRSHNFWIRQMGIASLAEKTNWDSFKYRNVAQACDLRTIVGLARYPYASDAFFLPPPKLCTSEQSNIVTSMQNILKKLPLPETINSSIYALRTMALQKPIQFQKDPMTMDLLTQLYTVPGEEQKKEKESLLCCLQAFQAYTMEPAYAVLFTELHGLALLQRLHEEIQEDLIQMYVLTILANLSQVPELIDSIIYAGWVYRLRKWSKGTNAALSILALTVLANLDRDWITSDVYQDMLLLHPSHRNSHPVYADIVLVHGVRGGAVKTWRQRDSENTGQNSSYSYCWPKDWLAADFQGIRVISVGYVTTLHRWGDYSTIEHDRRTIDGRCEDLMHKLRNAGVGSRPIIWMGHSLGGLLIEQILLNAKQDSDFDCLLHQTKGIVMYSVPHKGSGLVDIMMHAKYLLFPSIEVQELRTSSPKLKNLHSKFLKLMGSNPIPCLSFGENKKTDFGRPLIGGTVIVPKESSDPGFGQFVNLEANHIESCKPCGKEDTIYLNTKAFLRSILIKLDPAQK